MKTTKNLKTITNDQVTPDETAEILRLAEQTLDKGTEGDFVELGCYRGDTSVLLGKLLKDLWISCGKLVENTQPAVEKPAQNPVENFRSGTTERSSATEHSSPTSLPKTPKLLWIYDSFAGLPEKTREDASGAGANFRAGKLLVTKREVIEKLRKHGLKTSSAPVATHRANQSTPSTQILDTFSVIVKKAWFDDLAGEDLPEKIAFAFCDGDLYSSIKTSFRLVAPRLAKQGIIIVHDYNNPELPGSARAVDEFLRQNPNFQLKVHYTLAILTKKC